MRLTVQSCILAYSSNQSVGQLYLQQVCYGERSDECPWQMENKEYVKQLSDKHAAAISRHEKEVSLSHVYGVALWHTICFCRSLHRLRCRTSRHFPGSIYQEKNGRDY